MFRKWQTASAVVLSLLLSVACTSTPEEVEVIVTRQVQVAVTAENEAVQVEVTRVVTEVEVVQVTTTPSAQDPPTSQSKDLTVCMASEPVSLFPITNESISAYFLQAIYTNDFTNLSYAYQAEGLEKLPSLADGDAVVNEVIVNSGDTVVDATGEVVTLAEGMSVIDANDETVEFMGEPIAMSQLVVDFSMKQRYWSDGTPVTAADSVYGFEIASAPEFLSNLEQRTFRYEATGDLSTRWTGLPGHLDSTFFTNIWQPLPQHAWQEYSVAELQENVDTNRRPIGDGAFMVDEWVDGEYIRLIPNPYYYRADEGLPYLDSVTYIFISDRNELMVRVIAGECDIATRLTFSPADTPFLAEAEANGLLVPHFQTGTVFEHIDFGIDSYGDYGDGIGRPDWFEDVRVRQAITMCTDRQRMVDEILYGRSQIIHTYIPNAHPLYPEGLTTWPYDVVQGNALLDEVGFIDSDGDGWREDPVSKVPFQVTLIAMTGNDVRRQVVELFKENMVACGIDVQLEFMPFRELFADGPEGKLFGRQFDFGEFAWLTGVEPSCNLFTGSNITGPIAEGFGGWSNANNTGWNHEAFDVACQRAQGSLPGTTDYLEGHEEAQLIFSEELPIIPLFLLMKVATTRPNVVNFNVDPTENAELYNIYEIDLQEPAN